MERRTRALRAAALAALAATMLLAGGAARGAGVSVAITPTGQVSPGATFDLSIEVTKAGDPFNGFDAVIGYDPAALTFVPLSPLSLQEGSAMTDACGSTFHRFRPGVGTDTVTDVLMCSGVTLTGPGQIYRLRFTASVTPQVTRVRLLKGVRFFDAGVVDTNGVDTTGAAIGIGMSPYAGVEDLPPPSLSLRIVPNPSRGGLVFTVGSPRGGPMLLTVLDVQGRVVRRFAADRVEPGTRAVAWDGRDKAGARLPPGVFLARLEIAGAVTWGRVALIR